MDKRAYLSETLASVDGISPPLKSMAIVLLARASDKQIEDICSRLLLAANVLREHPQDGIAPALKAAGVPDGLSEQLAKVITGRSDLAALVDGAVDAARQ